MQHVDPTTVKRERLMVTHLQGTWPVVRKVWSALFRVLSTVLCIEFQNFFFFTLKINYSSVSFFSNKIYFKTIYLFHFFYKKNKLHKLVQ